MKKLRAFWFLALSACALVVSAQESPQTLLLGKWRHSSLVRIIDGNRLAPQQFDGTTTLEFKSDNTWLLVGSNNRSAGTYRWLSTDAIETSTLESGLTIQIGTISIKQVRVDRDRLNLITIQTQEEAAKFMPPPKPGVARPKDVIVTSVFNRDKDE